MAKVTGQIIFISILLGSVLSACGGGGNPAAVTQLDVPVTVVDGPIQGAVVCLDKDGNGICGADEPSGKTDAAGKVTLKIDPADAGKYAVISFVEAGVAVDADTGPVTTSFTLKAPADKPSVVTPLTTLVFNQMKSTGTSSDVAAGFIQGQTGISVSLFEDFSKGTTDGQKVAANIARMVVLTTQAQSNAVKDAVGTKDALNSTISSGDLDRLVQSKIAEMLPAMVGLLSDPTLQEALKVAQDKIDAATGAAKQSAQIEKDALIKAPAINAVAVNGISREGVALAMAIQKAPIEPVSTSVPSATLNLRWIDYTDASNYQFRVSGGTASQNTLTDGFYRYVFRMYKAVSGVVTAWNAGSMPLRQADLHWNGSNWVSCGLNFENRSTVRDVKGATQYDYCDRQRTGSSAGAPTLDISGKVMADVLGEAVKAGYTSLGTPSPALTAALGSAIFPPNAKAFFGDSVITSTAVSYYPGTSNEIWPETSTPCSWVTGSSYASAPATTLEQIVSKFDGKSPCTLTVETVNGKNGVAISSGVRNQTWGDTTLSLGTIGDAATVALGEASSYYTTNTVLRAGLGAKVGDSGTATFYACKQTYGGATRNCDPVGTGGYTITTLGDARTLRFSGLPVISRSLDWTRVFVERSGKVYWGYEDRPLVYKTNSLNTTATSALLDQLGIPAVNPDVPLALTPTSYQGAWDMYLESAPTKVAGTLFLNAQGGVTCANASGTVFACTLSSINGSTGAYILTDDGGVSVGANDFITGKGAGTYTATGGAPVPYRTSRR